MQNNWVPHPKYQVGNQWKNNQQWWKTQGIPFSYGKILLFFLFYNALENLDTFRVSIVAYWCVSEMFQLYICLPSVDHIWRRVCPRNRKRDPWRQWTIHLYADKPVRGRIHGYQTCCQWFRYTQQSPKQVTNSTQVRLTFVDQIICDVIDLLRNSWCDIFSVNLYKCMILY